jgi:CHASE2 domain-containing sensor protein
MRLPVRLPEYRLYQKWLAASIIALVCAAVGAALWTPAKILGAVEMLDHVFYDSLYRLRPIESQKNGEIVIVAVSDRSKLAMQRLRKIGWPWPRNFWGIMVSYLDAVGAKAIVFDLLFDGSSTYNRPEQNDDELFAGAIDASATPVVLATRVYPDGSVVEIVPPITNKILGAADISQDGVNRSYSPVVDGKDSLALQAIKQAKETPPDWAKVNSPFFLHYYGPHISGGEPVTFKYVEATTLLEVAENPNAGPALGITPDMLK